MQQGEDRQRRQQAFVVVTGLVIALISLSLIPTDSLWLGNDATPLPRSRILAWSVIAGAGALLGAAMILARRRAFVVNAAVLFWTAGVCLALSETALAVAGVRAPKRVVWRVPPQVSWWQTVPSLAGSPLQSGAPSPKRPSEQWPLNAQSMPDPDDFSAVAAARFSRRVLLVGDSFAYGVAASSQANSFARLLDDALDAAAPTLIWNASVPGTGHETMLAHLESFAAIQRPQLVVATFFRNDFVDDQWPPGRYYVFNGDDFVDANHDTPQGPLKLSPERAYRRAFAAEVPREFLKTLRTMSLLTSVLKQIRQHDAEAVVAAPYTPGATRGYTEARDRIGALRDAAKAAHASFLLLLIPSREDVAWPSAAYRDMMRICDELAVEYVDPRADLAPADYESPPKEHWNDHGHAKVASLLAKALAPRLP